MQVVTASSVVNPFLYYPGQEPVAAPSRTIISVSPSEYRKAYTYRGSPIYVLPAAPKGGYSRIAVHAHQVWQLNRNTVSDDNAGSMDLMPMDVEQVANDFLKHCIAGNLGNQFGVHPGVVLCVSGEPAPEEIRRAFDLHTEYARWCVNDGQSLYARDDVNNITSEHRAQADWLGARVPWRYEIERAEMKDCPACGEQINARALKCKECQETLPDFYAANGLDASGDPIVAAVLKARRATAALERSTPIAPAPVTPNKVQFQPKQ